MFQLLIMIITSIFLVAITPYSSFAATGNVNVQVNIDGLSELILSANTAQWHHINYDPPGATTINSSPWTPSGLTKSCNCYSDIFTGVNPPIPQNASNFDITINDGRGAVTIVQTPSASNDYKLIVRFDDNIQGGSDDYDVLISYEYSDCFATVDYLGNTNDRIRLTHPSDSGTSNGATHEVIVSVLAPDGTVRGNTITLEFAERETEVRTMKQIFDAAGLNIYDGLARGNIIQLGIPTGFLVSGTVQQGSQIVPLIFRCQLTPPPLPLGT